MYTKVQPQQSFLYLILRHISEWWKFSSKTNLEVSRKCYWKRFYETTKGSWPYSVFSFMTKMKKKSRVAYLWFDTLHKSTKHFCATLLDGAECSTN